jgi:hypothetical protein
MSQAALFAAALVICTALAGPALSGVDTRTATPVMQGSAEPASTTTSSLAPSREYLSRYYYRGRYYPYHYRSGYYHYRYGGRYCNVRYYRHGVWYCR